MLNYIQLQLQPLYSDSEIKVLQRDLMQGLYGLDQSQVILQKDDRFNESEILSLVYAVDDLKNHKPIQYILGKTEFFFRTFFTDSNVLIPRPETEELCEWIISEHKDDWVTIADIGTGSGCIPITLSLEIENSKVLATDVSEGALIVAKKNASENGAEVSFVLNDVLAEGALFESNSLDIVVSNPPYVLKSDQIEMEKNVVEYEPHIALFVENNDPLLFYRVIAKKALNWLKPNGVIYFEIHEKLGQLVVKQLEDLGYANVILKEDMFGKDRMVKAWR